MYFVYSHKMKNIFLFIILFDKTNIAQSDFILNFDIFKSYLFDKTIPILNKKYSNEDFITKTFLNLSDKFEDSIIFNSKSKSFLGPEYSRKYEKYLSGNFEELMNIEFFESHKMLLDKIDSGLKPIQIRFFEIIKYYSLKYSIYYNSSKIDINDTDISIILKEQEFKLYEINVLVELIMRQWYKNIIQLMINSFYKFLYDSNFVNIIIIIR